VHCQLTQATTISSKCKLLYRVARSYFLFHFSSSFNCTCKLMQSKSFFHIPNSLGTKHQLFKSYFETFKFFYLFPILCFQKKWMSFSIWKNTIHVVIKKIQWFLSNSDNLFGHNPCWASIKFPLITTSSCF
jgi:hypothetical protein